MGDGAQWGMGQGVFSCCSQNMNMKVFISDSSDTTEFAFNIEGPGKTFEASMSEHVQTLSNGHRELNSVLDCVQNHSPCQLPAAQWGRLRTA
jgi:hypothetical protein